MLSLYAPLVEGREPRHLALRRLTAPFRHRADEREFLRRQQIGALAAAPEHFPHVVGVVGRRLEPRYFTTSGELDYVCEVVEVELGGGQHPLERARGAEGFVILVAAE